ncbi:transmembrane protein 18-domain-containing protein [Dunaliella salina]|uniref:Transmembrane protein 18-domain-containing protein n=1 Tax=Dunaliella salina TaxID=3046 RepID=A0ABQ7GR43_DUNSA|nr:transmembrane protein 18-domain-containing protein [Dunaliella salina]|eukprot:KAF5837086.1 transmembrane protein 18-domain-containing protein [Dunaliella salina]
MYEEPWIITILVFQMVLLTLSIMTRKKGGIQAALFVFACVIIYMGERLNALGAKHWDRFATQNYFDQNGSFFTTIVSGPLLVLLFIVLVNYLLSCVKLLVEAKRKELKFKARQRRADQAGKEGDIQSGNLAGGDDKRGKEE